MNLDLHLLSYIDRLNITKGSDGESYFLDPIRKKKIKTQPEELVRQLCLYFLIHIAKYPRTHIQVEKSLYINGIRRRYDIIVFSPDTKPFMLVECKSYKVKLNQAVFDQVALYNLKSGAPMLWVSNGETNYVSIVDQENESYEFLNKFPIYMR